MFRVSGADASWNRTDRWNISYCIRPNDFGSDYARLVDFMQRAASGWEAAANVRYVHVVAEDSSTCDRNNNTVKYNVERNFSFTGLSAGMGFPTYTRSTRYLELGPTSTWTDEQLLAVPTHEIGSPTSRTPSSATTAARRGPASAGRAGASSRPAATSTGCGRMARSS